MSWDGLRLETQWANKMYWAFLNILTSFLCWNDDFSKKIIFLWENLGSPILSISCFSRWGHFAYVVCELLDTISMVYLSFYCKSNDTFLSRWQTAAQWRRSHEGKLTLLERIAKGLSGNQEPREADQSWSVCMCHSLAGTTRLSKASLLFFFFLHPHVGT